MSSTSPAVGRALDLLLYLAGKSGPVTGAAIARYLRIPRSSTYHLLDVLVARGFVVHFPDQRTYGLGVAAFEVGSAYLRHEPLEMLARPVLGRLATRLQHIGKGPIKGRFEALALDRLAQRTGKMETVERKNAALAGLDPVNFRRVPVVGHREHPDRIGFQEHVEVE